MYATNYFEAGILNTLRGITLAAPAKIYLGLFLTSPGENGQEGTEINYPGYTRQEIDFSEPAPEANGIGMKNIAQITFPRADQAAGTARYIGLFDSPVAGNAFAYGEMVEENPIEAGVAPVVLPGEIIYWLSGDMTDYYKTACLNVLRGKSLLGFKPYYGLYNGDLQSGGAELAGENYARQEVIFSAPSESQSGQQMTENSQDIIFSRPSTEWGAWAEDVLFDAQQAGHAVWAVPRSPVLRVKKGYMPMVEAGNFQLSIN